jgi:hypothetical protein
VEPSGREYLLLRRLYGQLLVLAERPMSEGNEIAWHDAQDSVSHILSHLTALKSDLGTTIAGILSPVAGSREEVMARMCAKSVVGSLGGALARSCTHGAAVPRFFRKRFEHSSALDRVYVAVGPTIGIGDELLAARGLTGCAAELGIEIAVETDRPTLWADLAPNLRIVGEPPLAIGPCLQELQDAELLHTGLIYLDFLNSDPAESPWMPEQELAFSARWVMGNASARIAKPSPAGLYYFKVPEEMAVSRQLECDCVAGLLLGTSITDSNHSLPPIKPVARRNPTLVLQALTSKPRLMFPSAFYADCLSRVRQLLGGPFAVRVLCGATANERRITEGIGQRIGSILGRSHVEALPRLDFAQVRDKLASASVLFGPDTFTGHLAAAIGTPQVTFVLPEHSAWCTAAVPAFYLATAGSTAAMSEEIAHRLALLLGDFDQSLGSGSELSHAAAVWHSSMFRLRTAIRRHFRNEPEDWSEVNDTLADAQYVFRHCARMLPRVLSRGRCLSSEVMDGTDLSDYAEPHDRVRALICWYQYAGTSDFSGLLLTMIGRRG